MSSSQTPVVESTDSELLMQFVKKNDHGAFRRLVERHARLVNSVCRRVLRNEQDIEDAFQATFLVLARQAASIRCRDSLVSWLFKVAHRTAIRAAVEGQTRHEAQLQDEPVITPETLEQIQDREEFEVLAVELERLPESCRAPMILFYLEGKSRRDAAFELDCSDASLKSRLARGRRLLRQRLIRRGVAFSLVLSVAAHQTAQAETAIGAAMIERTVAAGLEYAVTGKAGAACTSQSVNLAQGVQSMTSISLTKSTIAAVIILTAGLLTTVGFGVHQLLADSDSKADEAGQEQIDSAFDGNTTEKPKDRELLIALAGDKKKAQPNNPRARMSIDLKRVSPAEERIQAALEEPTTIEFTDTPLVDAMEFLSEQHSIRIILDEEALREDGISPDEPFNRVLAGISLRSLLNILLDEYGLTYMIKNEVMYITTIVEERARKETRVYQLKYLVEAGFEEEALKRVIESQQKDDGVIVEALRGLLIITQSQSQHRKTAELLQQLYRSDAVKP